MKNTNGKLEHCQLQSTAPSNLAVSRPQQERKQLPRTTQSERTKHMYIMESLGCKCMYNFGEVTIL